MSALRIINSHKVKIFRLIKMNNMKEMDLEVTKEMEIMKQREAN